MSDFIDQIEARIKLYEEEIAKLVTNHTSLMGALSELRNLLSIASDVAEIAVPVAAPALNMAEEIVDAIIPDEYDEEQKKLKKDEA